MSDLRRMRRSSLASVSSGGGGGGVEGTAKRKQGPSDFML